MNLQVVSFRVLALVSPTLAAMATAGAGGVTVSAGVFYKSTVPQPPIILYYSAAYTITNNYYFGVPYSSFSIMGPQTLF